MPTLTPAPWGVLQLGDAWRVVSKRQQLVAVVEREDDARAIACVPALLEQLQGAVELIESAGLDATTQRAALALAQGVDVLLAIEPKAGGAA